MALSPALHTSAPLSGGAALDVAGEPKNRFIPSRIASHFAAKSSDTPENMTRIIKSYDAHHKIQEKKPAKPALARFSADIEKAREAISPRYVPVTRTETAKTCQNSPNLDLSNPIGLDVFCDWLTCYQDHFDQVLPIINDGCVVRFEPEAFTHSVDRTSGEIRPMFDASKAEYTVQKSIIHEGSYDTKLSIRCDGRRVELSGNVGRFGRSDNLFGLQVFETVQRANEILAALGLPPFTSVAAAAGYARSDSFMKSQNVVITRVDLTANFSAGSRDAAFRVLHWMSGQGTARNSGKNPRNYGNGITWNEGSKRHYEKLYFKADELGQHVSQQVKDYCNENGVLRYEVSLKSRELADNGLQNLVAWSRVNQEGLRMDNVIYGRFAEVLTRNQVTVTEIQDIPGKYGLIAKSYLNGENPYEMAGYADRTKRLWRSQLIKYGIDIAQPIDVTRLTQRVRVIELQPMAAPSWYSKHAA